MVNVFTGLGFPFFVAPLNAGALGPLRSFAAYWITMLAAGIFIFFGLLAVQGIAALLFTYRLFLRVSGFIQLAAFFVILALYFLTPALATRHKLSAPENQTLLEWLPSFWFLGMFQELNGAASPVFGPLALRALSRLAIAFLVGLLAYLIAYYRHMRHGIEQPEIAPGDRSRGMIRIGSFLARKFFPRSLDCAILLFTARTMARSRQHRLLLAIFGGLGLAIALAYVKSLLSAHPGQNDYGDVIRSWTVLNRQFLAATLTLLFFCICGLRAVFALPIDLRSNWVFRMTMVHSPKSYFGAVRKCLLTLGALPVLACSAIFLLAVWPGRPAIAHLAACTLIALLLVDICLYRFRKIPFTCSYLPGGANLNVKLGIYAIAFLFLTDLGSHIELWAIPRLARFTVLLALLLSAVVWMSRRRAEFATSPFTPVQFEQLPPSEIFALDFRADSELTGGEQYIDVTPERTFWVRARPFVAGFIALALAGFAYERFGEWRDRERFPRIGNLVDVGGRSLNIYCSGEGSPTVILESNWGEPGYRWVAIQRHIAKFTRACWYDRAGYGWSDPGPFPHHSDSAARDLHALLTGAGISPPYVLVGNGMGAFHVRVYRGFYPSEVAGMVLVDPMCEDMTIHIHNHIEAFRPAVLLIYKIQGWLGVTRLMTPDPGPPPPGLTQQEWATLVALNWQAWSIPSQTKEPPLWVNGEMARASGGFGNMPLIVLSAALPGGEEDPKLEDVDWKLRLHAQLARMSTQGRRIVIANSDHMMLDREPEAIVDATRNVVEDVRR
ncbi:MAG: alpha/beta fold hydrolase [Bryobacteraceae bacterium]